MGVTVESMQLAVRIVSAHQPLHPGDLGKRGLDRDGEDPTRHARGSHFDERAKQRAAADEVN
jgi:hypothetical protein